MVTELMQCDLYAALGRDSLLGQLSWRRGGILIALDVARGLSCAQPSRDALWLATSCGLVPVVKNHCTAENGCYCRPP